MERYLPYRRVLFHTPTGSLIAAGFARSFHVHQQREGTQLRVKIIAYDRFKPGVTLDTVKPYLRDEVSNVWRLWKAGIVRENYARADQPGVLIVFECDSVATAQRYIDDFPLSKAGLLEWELIALDAPLPLEFLFEAGVDVGEPLDRTTQR
jgi:hypothetical protein